MLCWPKPAQTKPCGVAVSDAEHYSLNSFHADWTASAMRPHVAEPSVYLAYFRGPDSSRQAHLARLTRCNHTQSHCAPNCHQDQTASPRPNPEAGEAMRRQGPALERLDGTKLNLGLNRSAIPAQNILLIEAVHDLLTSREPIEELWEIWGKPNIWRVPHGHFSFSLIGAPY